MAKSGGGDFYNGVTATSLRFNRADSPELSYTPSANAAGRKTFTLSVWVKVTSQLDQYRAIFGAGGGGNRDRLQLFNNQKLVFNLNDGTDASLTTNALMRDTSAWYHVVAMLDTTQSTNTNRMKLYINGTETTYSATTYPDEDYTAFIGTNIEHFVGNSSADNLYMDGYLAEFNYTDGVANTPAAFGESKKGVWIPKKYTGSYGQNGFRLKFDQVGVGSASTSTIGADTSGLTNHLTSTNIVATDCAMPDNPENNFCTLNPIANLNFGSNHAAVHSEGNVKAVHSGTSISHLLGTFRVNDFLTDGCYFEIKVTTIDTDRFYVGIIDPYSFTAIAAASYANPNKALIIQTNAVYASTNTAGYASFTPDTATTIEAGDVIGVAVKGDNVWFHINGVYTRDTDDALGNPSTGANPAVPAITVIGSRDYFPYAGYASDYIVNFGQDPSFAATQTAGTETPDEGAGVFKYEVPTGFKAMCSANISDDDFPISPNQAKQADDYFETVLYEGDGSTQNIAVNFKPDWTWIKNRDATDAHQVFDSNRGATNVLSPNATAADAANDDTLTAFISTGFSLGDDVVVNTDGEKYVSWNWLANGATTSTLTGGTINSTVQANTDAGFSIVTYTGDDQARATVAHGLSQAPEWIIIKNRGETISNPAWPVYHASNTSAPATDYLDLQVVGATGDAETIWSDEVPTATLVILGTADSVNSGSAHVMYCFHSVDGYSKFGSYNGTTNVNGQFVYIGFSPAFLMIKRASATSAYSSWAMYDNKRKTINSDTGLTSNPLFANKTSIEGIRGNASASISGTRTAVDFLSNGFKIRDIADEVGQSNEYVYMAFADIPFKYANAR